MTKKININNLKKIKNKGTIALCHGVFDVLHYGHILYFKEAKKLSDILIVSVTTDKHVNKGPQRPLNSIDIRMKFLEELDIIDYVIESDSSDAVNIINLIKPNYYVKGPDYKNKKDDLSKKIYLEEKQVKKNGGKLVFTNNVTFSSSTIINKKFNSLTVTQKKYLKRINDKFSLEYIMRKINDFKKIDATVLGEPIIDSYTKVEVKGLGSKSPILASKYIETKDYAGGSLVIANHLNALGCKTNIFLPVSTKYHDHEKIYKRLDSGIKKSFFKMNDWTIPKKIRFLNNFKSDKIFEYYKISDENFDYKFPDNFYKKLQNKKNQNSLLFISDFGHNFFSDNLVNSINRSKFNYTINVQTNSANFGFNMFNKYKKFNFITLDEKELRLSENNNKNDVSLLIEEAYKKNKLNMNGSLTLGGNGSLYFTKKKNYYCPVFVSEPKDTVGSGDAYYCVASLLNHINCDPELIPFISNCYAGLKTRLVGNTSVSKISLVNMIKSLLA